MGRSKKRVSKEEADRLRSIVSRIGKDLGEKEQTAIFQKVVSALWRKQYLNDRQVDILTKRMGLYGGRKQTYTQIGGNNVAWQRIQQIVAATLERIDRFHHRVRDEVRDEIFKERRERKRI